jgi:arylsulfatase A-like enzyme
MDREIPRHVILISMDTARADHFGFLGGTENSTPRIDALAEESIAFTDYMTVVPTTLASHTSLFTGKYPHHHGTPRNGFMVHDGNVMLTEILRNAGFHTVGFAGSFALDSRFNFAQGFDHYDENFAVFVGEDGVDQNQRCAADITDAVIRYLNAGDIPDRIFLFVHYFDPHYPYAAPAPFDVDPEPHGECELQPIGALKEDSGMSLPEKERHARRYALRYAAEISYMDHHLGRLLDDLQRREILDDALLVVTSDHGENLWDHEVRFDHGFTVYQSTMRAVCLMRFPNGERGGARVDQLLASIDVMPTILDFLGLEVPPSIDGEGMDLRTMSATSRPRTRFGQATKPWEDVETDPRWTNIHKSRCVREGRFKFIQTPYRGTEELYDVISDPGENFNLLEHRSTETDDLASGFRRELEAWASSTRALPSEFEGAQRGETVERLRSLGYLE